MNLVAENLIAERLNITRGRTVGAYSGTSFLDAVTTRRIALSVTSVHVIARDYLQGNCRLHLNRGKGWYQK